jgi:hypothetical protein
METPGNEQTNAGNPAVIGTSLRPVALRARLSTSLPFSLIYLFNISAMHAQNRTVSFVKHVTSAVSEVSRKFCMVACESDLWSKSSDETHHSDGKTAWGLVHLLIPHLRWAAGAEAHIRGTEGAGQSRRRFANSVFELRRIK